MTTDYDRRSIEPEHDANQYSPSHDRAMSDKPSPAETITHGKRTHYIADIHARHSSAIRHTHQNPPTL